MCFGGDGGAGDIAKAQRADELARQARIKAGMAQINSIFDGTSRGVNAATSYDPSKTYYLADGSVYQPTVSAPTSFMMGAMRLNPRLANGKVDEMIRNGQLFTGVENTGGGFNQAYYDKIRQGYVDYAMPQLQNSFSRAKDSMVYALDRSGLLGSSASIDKNAELSREYDQNSIDIQNKGFDIANNARRNVEDARSAIVSQLNATGDNQAAANAAMRQAQAANQPQGYSPLGQLFVNFTNTLAGIGSNARNDYAGFSGRGGGLFSNSGSSRVVT